MKLCCQSLSYALEWAQPYDEPAESVHNYDCSDVLLVEIMAFFALVEYASSWLTSAHFDDRNLAWRLFFCNSDQLIVCQRIYGVPNPHCQMASTNEIIMFIYQQLYHSAGELESIVLLLQSFETVVYTRAFTTVSALKNG